MINRIEDGENIYLLEHLIPVPWHHQQTTQFQHYDLFLLHLWYHEPLLIHPVIRIQKILKVHIFPSAFIFLEDILELIDQL